MKHAATDIMRWHASQVFPFLAADPRLGEHAFERTKFGHQAIFS